MDRAKRKQPSADEPGEGGGAAGAAGDESKQAGGGGATGSSQYKRARVALVKVDETSGAIVKRVESRTSKLTAPIMLLTGHKAPVHCVKFDRTGEHIASGSFDKQAFLWSVHGDCEVYNVLAGHKNAILDLDWSGDCSMVVTASADKMVAIWDAASGKRIKKLAGHGSFVNSVSAAARGPDMVASGSDDGTVKLWDCRARRCASTYPHKYQITSVAMAKDGDIVYAGSLDNDIQVWDVRKGAVSMTLSGHTDTVTGLSVSPDGFHLLSNAMDNTVRAWDVRPFCATDRCVRSFVGASHGFQKMLLRCAWDGTGKRVGAGSSDHCVYVWDFESGELQYKLPGHTGSVNEVSFSPVEPIIASASSDKNIYLGELQRSS